MEAKQAKGKNKPRKQSAKKAAKGKKLVVEKKPRPPKKNDRIWKNGKWVGTADNWYESRE